MSSLVTGSWGANTFLVRKQLPNPHFQNTQTFVILVFLTFSSYKRWWRLHKFSFNGRHTLGPSERPFHALAKGQVATVGDSTGEIGELIFSISVQHFCHNFSFIYFPVPLLFVFCPYVYIIFAMLLCLGEWVFII